MTDSTDSTRADSSPRVLVIMGVSGSGKTTVAELLAERLGWAFEEGDALHPQANVEKMASGHPLNDDDRRPWLERIAEWIEARLDAGESGVVTCSALKPAYRDVLNRRGSGVTFVYLQGDHETIARRLAARRGHFMPPGLLDSQFADLQEPSAHEPAIRVDVGGRPGEIVDEIIADLGLKA